MCVNEMGVDEMGVDEMGVDEMGGNPNYQNHTHVTRLGSLPAFIQYATKLGRDNSRSNYHLNEGNLDLTLCSVFEIMNGVALTVRYFVYS